MRYFVTGATGYVGSFLIPVLSQLGHDITILVRPSTDRHKISALKNHGVSVVQADILQSHIYGFALRDAVVVNLAAEIIIGAPTDEEIRTMYQTNLEGVKQLFAASIAHDAKQLIHISSRQAVVERKEDIPSVYGRTKAEAHSYLRDRMREGSPVTILVPGMIYGERRGRTGIPKLVDMVRTGIGYFPESKEIPCTHVLDLVQAIVRASEHRGAIGKAFDICNGLTTGKELTNFIAKQLGVRRPKTIRRRGKKLLRILGRVWRSIPQELLHLSDIPATLKVRDGVDSLGMCYSDFPSSLEESIVHILRGEESESLDRAPRTQQRKIELIS